MLDNYNITGLRRVPRVRLDSDKLLPGPVRLFVLAQNYLYFSRASRLDDNAAFLFTVEIDPGAFFGMNPPYDEGQAPIIEYCKFPFSSRLETPPGPALSFAALPVSSRPAPP